MKLAVIKPDVPKAVKTCRLVKSVSHTLQRYNSWRTVMYITQTFTLQPRTYPKLFPSGASIL